MENDSLYNIRIIKTYIEYLNKYYPELDIIPILQYAGITSYELEDEGYWFTQEQADKFHEIVLQKTGNINVARDAGRFVVSSTSYGLIRQYITGFLTPKLAYAVMDRIGSTLTRSGKFKSRTIKLNMVETIFQHMPGVKEKPYQCANRQGMLEALGKFFTGSFAVVDHPVCIHNGGEFCKYLIRWTIPLYMKWKRFRNYFSFIALIITVFLFFFVPHGYFIFLCLLYAIVLLSLSFYSEVLLNREVTRNIESQSETAGLLLQETDKRYNDALLVQEIGNAISVILDIDILIETVMQVLNKRLDFDRGLIMMSNPERTRLLYKTGFGYSYDEQKVMENTAFHLDNPQSKGFFVDSFKKQVPYLIDNVHDFSAQMSDRSKRLADSMSTNSLICVPIFFKKESFGILAVDNKNSKRPLTKSDLSILMGIAQQISIGINIGRSFQQLQESEEKYRELVENANSIIMRMNIEGRITYFNEFAQRFFGFSEEEILGKDVIGTIIDKEEWYVNKFRDMLTDIGDHPERYVNVEAENILKSREKVWIAWTNRQIRDEKGILKEILCIGNNITARKEAEQEKAKLEVQLQHAQKMEAIGTLAGGVAHDLNNILTGILSYPQVMLMELPKDSPLRDDLITIMKSGEKAIAIVQDLLTLARRGIKISSVENLNNIVDEYFSSPEYNILAKNHTNVGFEFIRDPDLLNIKGSKIHLAKTVMNLVSNAAEAMPDGGKVIVSTQNRYVDKPVKGYENVVEGEYVVLRVIDSGIGISPEDLPRIFDPFYSKKVLGKSGSGLGMAVVWGTVRDHKGYIDIKSKVKAGTDVEIYFPITREELTESSAAVPVEQMQGRESILVVDDIPEQRNIALRFLSRLGYTVHTVSNGEEAINYIKEHAVDLILLDMIMDPGIDGLETYRRIIKLKPGQKAIIVSGFSETERVREALNLGAGSYLRKPYIFDAIGYAVRAELDRKL